MDRLAIRRENTETFFVWYWGGCKYRVCEQDDLIYFFQARTDKFGGSYWGMVKESDRPGLETVLLAELVKEKL